MSIRAYTDAEVAEHLRARLPSWSAEDGQIVRTFETGSFQRTLLLANAIGFVAEAAWHHPDLLLTFPRLRVMLTTHDAGGITEMDFELAERIESVATWQPQGGTLMGPDTPWFR
jgi:4a-hydroxytetrahydrobiopterin dehydratase